MCVTLRSGSTVTPVPWSSQSQNNPIFHGGANSRCFLSEVTVNNTSAFLAFDSNFFIAPRSGTFDQEILGVFPPGGNVTISMQCFSTTSLLAGVAYGNGTASGVNGVLVTGDTAQDVVCGLTGLGGVFSNPNTSDGIRTYRSGTTWGWVASAWKGIRGQCVR